MSNHFSLTLRPNPPYRVFRFKDDGKVPNSNLPALVYTRVFDIAASTSADEEGVKRFLDAQLEHNGWYAGWAEENAVEERAHFHKVFEGLLVINGNGRLRLGGERGSVMPVGAGDLVLLPPGVAHQRVSKSLPFRVAGIYPSNNEQWTMLYENPAHYAEAKAQIPQTPLPVADPFFGPKGFVMEYWK